MTEVAPSMSQKGTTLMSFLVVLPPVWGQLWCLSWWFCLLSWDNSDRCGIFWLGWLMDVGRYEGVAPSMWAFAAWFWRTSGSCATYAQKGSLMLRKNMGRNQRSAIFSSIGGPRFMFQLKRRRFLSQRAVPSYGYFGFWVEPSTFILVYVDCKCD